jgi:hypothetical protein
VAVSRSLAQPRPSTLAECQWPESGSLAESATRLDLKPTRTSLPMASKFKWYLADSDSAPGSERTQLRFGVACHWHSVRLGLSMPAWGRDYLA